MPPPARCHFVAIPATRILTQGTLLRPFEWDPKAVILEVEGCDFGFGILDLGVNFFLRSRVFLQRVDLTSMKVHFGAMLTVITILMLSEITVSGDVRDLGFFFFAQNGRGGGWGGGERDRGLVPSLYWP